MRVDVNTIDMLSKMVSETLLSSHLMMRLLGRLLLFLFLLAAIAAASKEEAADDKDGRIAQSLFRFSASQLGPEFEHLLNLWYDEWLYTTDNETESSIITPDPSGKQHAFQSVSTPATTLFRRQCYGAAPIQSPQFANLYNNLEQRRKEIEFQYIKDPKEEMNMMHTMVKRFYAAFLPVDSHDKDSAATHMHKKKVTSTVDTIHAKTNLPLDYDSPSKLAFQTTKLSSDNNDGNDDTPIQQWSWRPAGQFSNRGMPNFLQWRMKFFRSMRAKFQNELSKATPGFAFSHGRPSGMYWYPPGAVREWHSNYLDLIGNTKQKQTGDQQIYASQMWRMYFIRTVRDDEFDGLLQKFGGGGGGSNDVDDRSAMHIIPGEDEGITLDVLQKAGARPLTADEKKRQWKDVFAEEYTNSTSTEEDVTVNEEGTLDRNSLWRLPDKNGYVTFFRLPKLFHCIVSEEVHRYSLGFAFSDEEVQALLRLAGVDFDVAGEDEGSNGTDEL